MSKKIKLAALLALTTAALFSLASIARAVPLTLDDHCSRSPNICEQIMLLKNGNVKFLLESRGRAVQGEYTLCVKGPSGKECKEFELQQPFEDVYYVDKVAWKKEFPTGTGRHVVTWKYMGDRLGAKLEFTVKQSGEVTGPGP
jgi:hypothetical protein